MSDLISRQALRDAMYHEAFETDTEMQRWDSGCWIRYKLFENIIDNLPSAEPVIIYCKDCKHWYPDADTGMACEFTNMSQPEDGFCNWAERRTDEGHDIQTGCD